MPPRYRRSYYTSAWLHWSSDHRHESADGCLYTGGRCVAWVVERTRTDEGVVARCQGPRPPSDCSPQPLIYALPTDRPTVGYCRAVPCVHTSADNSTLVSLPVCLSKLVRIVVVSAFPKLVFAVCTVWITSSECETLGKQLLHLDGGHG